MSGRGEKVTKGFVVKCRYDGKDRLGNDSKIERQEGRMFHARGAADTLCEMMKKAHPDWEVWVSEVRGFDKCQDMKQLA